MKKLSLLCIVVTLAGLLARPASLLADTPGAAVTFVGQHYEGLIAQLDSPSQTGTVTTRFGDRSLPFKVNDDTRIWKTQRLSVRSLAVGQLVMVIGQTTKTDNLIQPFLIDILPALPPENANRPGFEGKRKKGIFGAIESINADAIDGSMTVTDRDGRTVTVALRGYRPLVGQTVLGDFRDLATGAPIKIDGKIDSNTMVATRIVLQVSLHGGKNNGGGRRDGNPGRTIQYDALP